MRWILIAAAVSGASSVILGAMAAHMGNAANMATGYEFMQIGLKYHQWFSLFLLALGLYSICATLSDKQTMIVRLSSILAILGILLFSGGLYASVMLDMPVITKVTPFGGFAFIGAWLSLIILAVASREKA